MCQLPVRSAAHLATVRLVLTPAAAVLGTAHKQGKGLSRLSRMTAPDEATPGVAADARLPGAAAQTPAAEAGPPDESGALAAGLFATPQAASRSQVGTVLLSRWGEQCPCQAGCHHSHCPGRHKSLSMPGNLYFCPICLECVIDGVRAGGHFLLSLHLSAEPVVYRCKQGLQAFQPVTGRTTQLGMVPTPGQRARV